MSATDARGRYLGAVLEREPSREQLAVITHPLVPQLVVAGAGSGKTGTIAARVVHLVAHHGIAPSSILGLTFTNKAAGELAERVRRGLARLGRDHDGVDALPTVSTYHAYAASVVRDHALRIGREPVATLLTEAGQWQLARRVVAQVRSLPDCDLQPATVAARLVALDGDLAEHCVGVEDVRADCARLIAGLEGCDRRFLDVVAAARLRLRLLELVAAYAEAKRRRDLVDYGDQVRLAVEIAEAAPEVGVLERARYAVVVLDEYQDTGVGQRRLLTALFGGGHPVTAVGDPNQAIYGWRGASVGNLLRFGQHFPRADGAPVRPQPLMTSYRCGGRILAVANALAAPLTSDGDVEVPPLDPRPGAESAGEVRLALLETGDDEASWVAREVAFAVAAGTPPGGVAVLCRRSTDFPALHVALVAQRLPVEVVGLGGLLEMPEVADVVAVLRLLSDPLANTSFVRLLTGPRWRIGPRDLAALGRRARRLASYDDAAAGPLERATAALDPVEAVSLLDAVDRPGDPTSYSAEARERLAAFRDELSVLRPLVGQPLVELVTEVVHRTGLDIEIEASPLRVATARAANLAAFLDHAAGFAGLDGETDLASFLAFLDAAADAENGLDMGGVSSADTVKLLTAHKAKGLEWDVVAVPRLTQQVFPSARGRAGWLRSAEVLPFRLRGDRDDLPPDPEWTKESVEEFTNAWKEQSQREERRLAYVAVTRARSLVLLSGSWWLGTRKTRQGPSAYLEEVRAAGLPGVVVSEWCTDPAAQNPTAAEGDVAWPPEYDAAGLAARREAARRVREPVAQPIAPADPADRAVVGRWELEARLLLAELRAERSGERIVELPRRLTTSDLVALSHDEQAFARSLARPVPGPPRREARRGTRFHSWVESFYGEHALLDLDDLAGPADEVHDVDDAALAELQRTFLASEWADRRPVSIEQPFELVVGGRILRGRMDAVYRRSDGGYDVIDYKTGSVPRDISSDALQLTVYRLAWADIAGVDPEQVGAGFLYVRSGQLLRPEQLLSREELNDLLQPAPQAAGSPGAAVGHEG